ncbi:uncharacterized protein LOC141636469 [Silene latifolia]|uniref:uncharacterized protein LOC141636469 n=1 Tax=Silene latifolia TaxID=37657 RepID=UPI003D7864DA
MEAPNPSTALVLYPHFCYLNSESTYSVKSGYGIALESHLNKACNEKDLSRISRSCVAFCKKRLWRLPGPQKWKVLVWRILTNFVSNGSEFQKRGIGVDHSCRFCYGMDNIETLNHLFQDCDIVARIWSSSNLGIRTCNDSHMPVGEWIINWINYLSEADNGEFLVISLIATIWCIWCTRNNLVFRGDSFSPEAFYNLQSKTTAEAIAAYEATQGMVRTKGFFPGLQRNEVREKLENSFPVYLIGTGRGCNSIRVKVDAGWHTSLVSAAGWVTYDHDGFIIFEGGRSFWSESALQAEAKGIREALRWASANGIFHLDVFSDCLQILLQITGVENGHHLTQGILLDIEASLPFFHCISFSFIPRNLNSVAHRLAKRAMRLSFILLLYSSTSRITMPESTPTDSSGYDFYDDPFFLSTSDQPTSHLTTVLFDGADFLGWKQKVLMALASKNKESFLDDSNPKPAATDKKYRQWIRCDLMVMRWILNSLDKTIRDNLKYVTSARRLWSELSERYDQANSIEIYQLTKDMGDTSQGNSSLIEYYSKLKSSWENLDSLDPLPSCSCGKCNSCTCFLFKRMQEKKNNIKLIQFLMGLNGGYDNIRAQILSLDALPTINKALEMLQKIEKQKRVTESVEVLTETTAYASYKVQECAYCGKLGHKIEKCYRLVGFPAVKNNKGKGKMSSSKYAKKPNSFKKSANNIELCDEDSALNELVEDQVKAAYKSQGASTSFDAGTLDGLVTSAIDQVMKRLSENQAGPSTANFAGIMSASQVNSINSNSYMHDWIIDTRASDHITFNVKLLHNVRKLKKPIPVGLADETVKLVYWLGDIRLTDDIVLDKVMLIPGFRQNLLSMSKLIDNNCLSAVFSSKKCVFQDHSSEKTVAVGRRVRDLYRFQYFSSIIKYVIKNVVLNVITESQNEQIVHNRLGHIGYVKLRNIVPRAKSNNKQKVIRSDNDTEFLYQGCGTLFKSKGLLHQTSVVGTHQQNGRVERKYRDVVFQEDKFPFTTLPTDSQVDVDLVNPATSSILVPVASTNNDMNSEVTQSTSNEAPQTSVAVDIPDSTTAPARRNSRQRQVPHLEEIRKSTRPRVIPPRFQDYQCSLKSANAAHAEVFSSIMLDQLQDFAPEYIQSLSNVIQEPEPYTFKQASQDQRWVAATDKEIQALEDNKTWDIVPLPEGHKAIGSKWIFKIKYKQDGSIERFKARLVAKWYSQVKDKDYTDTFSPVAKFTTVRTLLVVAAASSWNLHQLDINNAFLHGFLDKEVYMKPPEGYKVNPGHVCRLRRSLYGLKQASRQWNKELSKHLINIGVVQSRQDYSLFTRFNPATQSFLLVLVYVDDLIITGTSDSEIVSIKEGLDAAFSIKDLGFLRYFLGLEISRNHKGIMVTQRKYILDILSDLNMENCVPNSFPMPRGLKLSIDQGTLLEEPEQPDLSYYVQHLSQFLSQPREPHLQAAMHVLKYLKGTINIGLMYSAQSDLSLCAYTDKTKKQKTVSKSTADSEYMSMSYTSSELVWLDALLAVLRITVPKPVPLYCDNKAA